MPRSPKFSDPRSVLTCKVPNGKRNHRFADITSPGLQLYASVSGARIWKYRYNFGQQRNLEIDLGPAAYVTYEEARERAAKLNRAKAEGRDPRLVGLEKATEATFIEVVRHHQDGLSEASRKNLKTKFAPLLDRFGEMRVRDVERREVAKFIREQWPDKITTQRLVARNITAAFNKAADPDNGLVLPTGFENPFAAFAGAFQRPAGWKPQSRKVAYEEDQFEAIFRAIDLGRRDTKMSIFGVLCLELTLRTGARPSEIQSLKWEEVVDVPGSPNTRLILKPWHKTARKTNEMRRILVAKGGVALLEEAKAEAERQNYTGPYVFPAARVQRNNATAPHFTSSWAFAKRLGERVGFDFKPGSFRSAYINHTLSACEARGSDFSEALKMVATNVGHRDIQVTLRHYLEGRLTKADELAQLGDENFDRYSRAA